MRSDLPLGFRRQARIGPARIGIGFKVAHVTNRLSQVNLAQAGERHHPPPAVAFFPVQGSLPFLLLHSGPALREPEQGGFIAAIFYEGQVFTVRD